MATTNKDTKVVTGKVRFSYCHIFKPQAMEVGQDPKYSLCILIPKSDKETLKKIQAAINAAIEAGKSKWGGKTPPNLKKPLRDGDTEKDTDDYPEYKGHYFINATSKQKPGVIDRDKQEVLDSTEVYSGCFGRVSLNFYAFDTKGNKGIAAGLNNVQKIADGDYLGGRSSAEDDFDDDLGGDSEDWMN
ncbi:DUF2815 family protein [Paenibacillus albidus]|uniref:DUF2815 family protein n=1 Tax=Paenibacillus albidus TaxID=2041023 RepID=UPI001BE786FD|nr:DUF2815 family protein [Paenibacillus albidus]MBT2287999.1 DUF2815 family protein [Paenibacillus albidus]